MVIDGDEGGGGGEEEEGEDEALRASLAPPPGGASSSASAAPALVPFGAAQLAALVSPPAPLPVRSDDTFGSALDTGSAGASAAAPPTVLALPIAA